MLFTSQLRPKGTEPRTHSTHPHPHTHTIAYLLPPVYPSVVHSTNSRTHHSSMCVWAHTSHSPGPRAGRNFSNHVPAPSPRVAPNQSRGRFTIQHQLISLSRIYIYIWRTAPEFAEVPCSVRARPRKGVRVNTIKGALEHRSALPAASFAQIFQYEYIHTRQLRRRRVRRRRPRRAQIHTGSNIISALLERGRRHQVADAIGCGWWRTPAAQPTTTTFARDNVICCTCVMDEP